MFLEKYKKNFYSQSGEDGIINEILKRLNLYSRKNKWCCEFGAWDTTLMLNKDAITTAIMFVRKYFLSEFIYSS